MVKALRMTMEQVKEKVAHLQSLQAELVRFFKEMEDVTINTSLAYATAHFKCIICWFKTRSSRSCFRRTRCIWSTKSACSSKANEVSRVLVSMGVHAHASAIRISLAPENTMEEVKQFEGIVKETMPKLYEVMR